MAEKIEKLEPKNFEKDEEGNLTKGELFYTGPAEFLVANVVSELKKVPQWKSIFGDYVDPYKRMDYSTRNLPALRIYNDNVQKQHESWFVEGDLKADAIFPSNVRRNELQQFQDTLSMALMQQFRRPEFFATLCTSIPGLNELGKRYTVDKSLGFEWGDNVVPLTQIVINFRIDLRVWDEHLEDSLRTKDSPFEEVLGELETIASTIEGLKDDNETTEVSIDIEQEIEGDE